MTLQLQPFAQQQVIKLRCRECSALLQVRICNPSILPHAFRGSLTTASV